ncbi:MAG: glycosyltransferase family 4 protein [Planctomycetota bacterium]
MRIAMLSSESLHSMRAGGLAVHATELAASLQRKGHEIHLFTQRAPGQDNYGHYDGVHYHMVDRSRGSDLIHEVHNMNKAMVDRFLYVTDFVGRFDLVHGHDWLAAEGLVEIKERWGLRGILTMHSTEYGRSGNIRPEHGNSQRVSELERYGTYSVNDVIAVSHHLKQEIMDLYQCPDWKVHVVYNGVNVHEFDGFLDPGEVKAAYAIGPLEPMILFVGRATVQKGPDILMEAVPRILRDFPDARFVLAADGELLSNLRWRAGELGVAHAVRFLGYVGRYELVRLMRACDVVAVPSRNEPFGIVVLEAWSAGKPVVVTNKGGPDEFIDHDGNGLKVCDNPDSIAWGVRTLLANPDHARWLGENGRKTVEARFSWDLIGDYTLGVYQHVLQI